MIKVCRSCLAVTLAALMLTVPVVAADDQANQAAGKEREITKIRLKLHDGKAFPKYLGSKLTAPEEIVDEYQAGYVDERNAQRLGHRILKNVKLEYVTQNHKPYSDKILWPLKKNAQGYVYDESKALFLKLTFSVGEDGGYKYKIDVRKELPVEIGDPQFTIPANGLKEGQDGTYTAYLPLNAYRKVKFIPDDGINQLYLEGSEAKLNNPLELELDISAGETTFATRNKKIKFSNNGQRTIRALYVKLPNGNSLYRSVPEQYAFEDLDEMKKTDALKPIEVTLRTWNDNDPNQIPPILTGQDKTINEGERFDRYSLVAKFHKVANEAETKDEAVKKDIKFDMGNFDENNPAQGKYDIKMSFTNKTNRLTATWTSTVIVRAKQKPPVPAPQPQPKQQEKTGNAYFDLGRYLLPTCPDSKCAKIETGAKKDDVPNTAAAVNN